MTHHYTFAILLLIAATPLCQAMNENIPVSKAKILTELTVVKNPILVACFPNNRVAIAGRNSCSLCDYSINTEITKICTFDIPYWRPICLTTHPNKKMLAIGDYIAKLIVYNVETKKIYEKILDLWDQPIFNPIDDTIFIHENYGRTITEFNYNNDSCKSYPMKQGFTLQTFHPTKQNLYLASKPDKLSVLNFDKNSFTEQKTILQLNENNTFSDISKGHYSPNRSVIAMIKDFNVCCIDPESNTETILEHSDKYNIWATIFHPTSFILAGLSTKPHALCYWNTKTQQLITTTPLPFESNGNYIGKRLDFTCRGKQLVVVVKNMCPVLDVPFEALYKDLTEDKAIFTHWLLKNYQRNQNNVIPNEIIDRLITNLLEASEYSFTNY